MMTTSELIEKLQQFDPMATVGYNWRTKDDFQEIENVELNSEGDVVLE